MISKRDQNKIKKELSSGENGYYETLAIYLRNHAIYNAKGDEFSESMIRMMLTTKLSHARLEKAIFNCFDAHVKARKLEVKRRKAILKSA